MAVVVVGGHSRNIGKTSLAAGLIAAFPECGWAAVKITQYGHGICSINGRACGCAAEEHRYALLEEKSREGRTDSSRFLVAGARRSLWLRTKQGQLDRAMPQLKPILETEQFVIMESNSVLEFISPTSWISNGARERTSTARMLPRWYNQLRTDRCGKGSPWKECPFFRSHLPLMFRRT